MKPERLHKSGGAVSDCEQYVGLLQGIFGALAFYGVKVMGWKNRGRKRYYYRSQGGKKVYLGRGPAAEAAARHDTARRELVVQARAELELTRRQFLQAEGAVRSFLDFTATLVGGALVAAGYHRHDRGEWRSRRADIAQGASP